MPWQDRIREAAYTPPSGGRITLVFEDVVESFDKNTTAFEFPDVDGTFVQDLGRSGRRLPMRVYFNGDDYDLAAAAFMDALGEKGIGTLEHPTYGTFSVIPFGRVSRRDDLKTRANQAVINVVFFETNTLLFPISVESPAVDTIAAIVAYNEAVPIEFEESLDLDTTLEEVSLRDRYSKVVAQAKAGLQAIASVTTAIENEFNAVFLAINDAIDVFIADPLALAFQTSILVQLPARSEALIADRLDAYGDLLVSLTSDSNIYAPGSDSQPGNRFRADDLLVSNLLMGAISSVLQADFGTRTEAISAADRILTMADDFIVWRDANLVSLGQIDTGGVYRSVIDAVASVSGFLVQLSFSLKQEREIMLVEPHTPIDLEALLYGTVGDNLDFLISSNQLVGDELFEVPAGRMVVHYT